MYWKVAIISALVMLACCAIPVSATDFLDTCKDTAFCPWYNYTENSSKAPPVYGSIMQGGIIEHQYFIPIGKTDVDISLEWDRSKFQNDITMTVITPSLVSHGPYSDSFDGNVDGVIAISSIGTIGVGVWKVIISGVSVIGTQSYILRLNAN